MATSPLRMVKNPPLTRNAPFATRSRTNGYVCTFSTLLLTFSCSNALNRSSSVSYVLEHTRFTLSSMCPHHASTEPLPSSFTSSSFNNALTTSPPLTEEEEEEKTCDEHITHSTLRRTIITSAFPSIGRRFARSHQEEEEKDDFEEEVVKVVVFSAESMCVCVYLYIYIYMQFYASAAKMLRLLSLCTCVCGVCVCVFLSVRSMCESDDDNDDELFYRTSIINCKRTSRK
mmetsp:Transcript_3231/g.9968  ORF Transcript_3231/g.9968 Transcript_3231/m.9968 type:complete len:230 (-) Transcript_3231:114-803(-)